MQHVQSVFVNGSQTNVRTVKRFPFLTGHPEKAKSKTGHKAINGGIDVFERSRETFGLFKDTLLTLECRNTLWKWAKYSMFVFNEGKRIHCIVKHFQNCVKPFPFLPRYITYPMEMDSMGWMSSRTECSSLATLTRGTSPFSWTRPSSATTAPSSATSRTHQMWWELQHGLSSASSSKVNSNPGTLEMYYE